jgi:hypothetical protein
MKRPSPALLVAMLALIVALGGTAVGAGGHADKAKDTKLFNNLLKKKAPKLSVKRAATAGNADRTDRRGLGCPAGTVESQGECFEAASREPVSAFVASQKCAEAGGQLPAALALRAADVVNGVVTLDAGGEWSSNMSYNPENLTYYVLAPKHDGGVNPLGASDTRRYRCVFSLVRRLNTG